MRHNVSKIKLGRPKNERDALMKSLAQDIILHGRIRTTEAKAKAVRPMLERLLTTPRRMEPRNAIRALKKVLSQETASRKVMGELKAHVGDRASGSIRIRKVGVRKGDAAPLVQIEII
jgi:large subunit ribosomal protein L17